MARASCPACPLLSPSPFSASCSLGQGQEPSRPARPTGQVLRSRRALRSQKPRSGEDPLPPRHAAASLAGSCPCSLSTSPAVLGTIKISCIHSCLPPSLCVPSQESSVGGLSGGSAQGQRLVPRGPGPCWARSGEGSSRGREGLFLGGAWDRAGSTRGAGGGSSAKWRCSAEARHRLWRQARRKRPQSRAG